MRCFVFIDISSADKVGFDDSRELLTLVQNRNESWHDVFNFRSTIDNNCQLWSCHNQS
jgi:hypothetical protein